MPAATQGADDSSRDERLQRAITLLSQALSLIDQLEEYPELGARLQGLIEDLRDTGA